MALRKAIALTSYPDQYSLGNTRSLLPDSNTGWVRIQVPWYWLQPTSSTSDPGRLAALRRLDIILATGRDDRMRSESQALSATLWEKGIGNALRLWDGWSHDWPYWEQMMRLYVGGHD